MTIQLPIRENATPAEKQLAALYSQNAESLPGADVPGVRAWRDAGITAFAEAGLPHRRIEEWKYTDLRTLLPQADDIANDMPEAPDFLVREEPDVYRAVFIGGRFRADYSTVQNAPGVTFRSLREALNDAATAAEALARLPLAEYNAEHDSVTQLATAFATDGAMLAVAPGIKLDKPLHLVFIAAGTAAEIHACRSALSLGEGADVSLVETHAGTGAAQMFTTLNLNIAGNATLRHARLDETPDARHLSAVVANLEAGAAYDPVHIVAGGALTRAQNHITFNGEGARYNFNGAMLLKGREHADFTQVVDHTVPSCESRETVKSVLDGESRGIFQAKVIVRPDAQKTDGRQLANGLLLSETAEFDAKPELEIYADDVKCNHGATSGALDEDMLFYLRSRGIPTDEAKSMLILAFVGEIIDQIEDEAFREILMAKARDWLAKSGAGHS
ncbi:MAG: Fe-S cluster assembly protein SufD [Alphaproteobacteria bacterium]